MNNPAVQPPASAYFITPERETVVARTLAILVDNEPGVLARVIGMFSGRGYNIESLTVSETEHEKHLSRITVVTRGAPHVIEQLKSQLDRIVPVHRVVDLTTNTGDTGEGRPIERELAIIKVAGQGEKRVEALRLADVFRAKVVDSSIEHFVFEITGRPTKLDKFVSLMAPLGVVEICRTGVAALSRGKAGM
ncbi:acetolactate synthase small subunit [Jiella mangrovi]|uniref:Acetolactate synthase small subunit n=1 Tax=Jiella mangrovi TaxID=2821407 RepID=A0ABS4BDN4_9HYPH|nr:acetolactate synthase small subunit [Jiella mangrovi]MBP0614861.1 acetolactate synthase small subunit [Jiella mangrovi]